MCAAANQENSGVVSLLKLAFEEHKARAKKKQEKRVRFSNVEIREYALIEGDHPYCPEGLALSLDWIYSSQTTVKNVIDAEDEKVSTIISPPRRLGCMDRRMRLQQAAS